MLRSASDPTFFATTRWTLVREAASSGNPGAGHAWGELAGIYWQPLYRYARRKGKSNEDAEDLVQGFLAHLMEPQSLAKVDGGRGRFRAFLLGSFNHWMINDWKRGSRHKRGGGSAPLSLDWREAESGLAPEIPDDSSPDMLFDREWAHALLRNVLDQLAAACRADGHGDHFEILKSSLTMDSGRVPYRVLAEQLRMTEGAARVAVHRLRGRYRALLTAEIGRTLSSPEAIEDEMRSLFAALAG